MHAFRLFYFKAGITIFAALKFFIENDHFTQLA